VYTRILSRATDLGGPSQTAVFIDTNLAAPVFCRALTQPRRRRESKHQNASPLTRDFHHETHLSAQPPKARPHPWLPRSHENPRWSRRTESAAREGPATSNAGLITRSQKFRQTDRLKQAVDFDAVFSRGTRASDRYFTFIALPNHLDHSRLGIAVSKKALRQATERNRVRRLIRESYRLSVARAVPVDLVVMVKNTAKDVPASVLATALNQRWLTVPEFHQRLQRALHEAPL